ncbi:Cytochrome P450 6k1 [Camponotus floridanus]|uniref:Cytochrome P450 6k1 n=1 Tax=Camponotus floridanus TaxID=104421 RepID=E2AAX7_CAMFO|nr:Cytochrome P450 6k1 [Camponotus floridanus]
MIFHYNIIRGLELLAIFFLLTTVRLTRIKVFGKGPTIFLRKVFWETLNYRMESGIKRNDLIDILFELKKNDNDQDYYGFKFDGDNLLAQAASFSAGFETSSTTTAFTLYELELQSDIQNTLRKEIVEALESGRKITYDLIKLALIIILSKCEVRPCEKTSIPMVIDPKGAMTVPLNDVLYLNFRKIKSNAL